MIPRLLRAASDELRDPQLSMLDRERLIEDLETAADERTRLLGWAVIWAVLAFLAGIAVGVLAWA